MRKTLFILACIIGIVLSACRSLESTTQSTPGDQQISLASPSPKSTLPNTQSPTRTVRLAPTETSTPTATMKPTSQITKSVTPEVSAISTIAVKKSAPVDLEVYIGHIYPPLPEGFSEGGYETLIDPGSDTDFADIDYGLQTVHFDQLYLLLFDKFVKRERNVSYWKILDILVLPDLIGESVFVPQGCMLEQELDYEIMAIGNLDEEAYRTRFLTNEKISQAWRANRLTEAIEPIPVEGIECHSDRAFHW